MSSDLVGGLSLNARIPSISLVAIGLSNYKTFGSSVGRVLSGSLKGLT